MFTGFEPFDFGSCHSLIISSIHITLPYFPQCLLSLFNLHLVTFKFLPSRFRWPSFLVFLRCRKNVREGKCCARRSCSSLSPSVPSYPFPHILSSFIVVILPMDRLRLSHHRGLPASCLSRAKACLDLLDLGHILIIGRHRDAPDRQIFKLSVRPDPIDCIS